MVPSQDLGHHFQNWKGPEKSVLSQDNTAKAKRRHYNGYIYVYPMNRICEISCKVISEMSSPRDDIHVLAILYKIFA